MHHIIAQWGVNDQAAQPLRAIVIQHENCQCSCCGGFGHRLERCATWKRFKIAAQGNMPMKHQLGLLRAWLDTRYAQQSANSLTYYQTAQRYAGTFKGQIFRDMHQHWAADNNHARSVAAGIE